MPAPFLIADQRAFVDYLGNANSAPPGPASSGLQGTQTGISAASGAIAATETIFLQKTVVPWTPPTSGLLPDLPGGTLNPGTLIRFNSWGLSTSSAANTTTFNVYLGAAGTTSDTKIITFTTAAAGTTGTNVLFLLNGNIQIRAVGATGTLYYVFTLTPTAATAIGGSASSVYFNGTQNANFNTTTAVFLSFSIVNAASTTSENFQIAAVEILP